MTVTPAGRVLQARSLRDRPLPRQPFQQGRPTTGADGLAALAYRLAAQEGLWRPLVRFDAEERHYARLPTGGGRYEAWLLTWTAGQRTGLHDHGGSAGAFTVLSGWVDELTLAADPVARLDGVPAGTQLSRRTYAAGSVRAFGTEHVHDVVNASPGRAITLHVYAPRLDRMTRYELGDEGLRVVAREEAGSDW